jgi:hypothetical protein
VAYTFRESKPTPTQISIAVTVIRPIVQSLQKMPLDFKGSDRELRRANVEESKENMWHAQRAALFQELQELPRRSINWGCGSTGLANASSYDGSGQAACTPILGLQVDV